MSGASNSYGDRFTSVFDAALSKMSSIFIDLEAAEVLEACPSPGSVETTEFSGEVVETEAFAILTQAKATLQKDASIRYIVFDHANNAPSSEDGVWLKTLTQLGIESVYWNVGTQRTIDQQTFDNVLAPCLMEPGSPGTTLAVTGEDAAVVFSDHPSSVAECQVQGDDALVIRVFRCAPRPSLSAGIQAVLDTPKQDNVFDIWIRHGEIPEGMHDMGCYEFEIDDDSVALKQKLTAFVPAPVPPMSQALNSSLTSVIKDLQASLHSRDEDVTLEIIQEKLHADQEEEAPEETPESSPPALVVTHKEQAETTVASVDKENAEVGRECSESEDKL